jgi:hypothetical protein
MKYLRSECQRFGASPRALAGAVVAFTGAVAVAGCNDWDDKRQEVRAGDLCAKIIEQEFIGRGSDALVAELEDIDDGEICRNDLSQCHSCLAAQADASPAKQWEACANQCEGRVAATFCESVDRYETQAACAAHDAAKLGCVEWYSRLKAAADDPTSSYASAQLTRELEADDKLSAGEPPPELCSFDDPQCTSCLSSAPFTCPQDCFDDRIEYCAGRFDNPEGCDFCEDFVGSLDERLGSLSEAGRLLSELLQPCVQGGDFNDEECEEILKAEGRSIQLSGIETLDGDACAPSPSQSEEKQRETQKACLERRDGKCTLCIDTSQLDDDWSELWADVCELPQCATCLSETGCGLSDSGDDDCGADAVFNACSEVCFDDAFACAPVGGQIALLARGDVCDLVDDCPVPLDADGSPRRAAADEADCSVSCGEFGGRRSEGTLSNPDVAISAADLCETSDTWVAYWPASAFTRERDPRSSSKDIVVASVSVAERLGEDLCISEVTIDGQFYTWEETWTPLWKADEHDPSAKPLCGYEVSLDLKDPIKVPAGGLEVRITFDQPWVSYVPNRIAYAYSDDVYAPEVPLQPLPELRQCSLANQSGQLDEDGCVRCGSDSVMLSLYADGRSHLLRDCDCHKGWLGWDEFFTSSFACDGIENCSNGLDEKICCGDGCDCSTTVKWLRPSAICDGVVDCDGGEDENFCIDSCDVDALGDGACTFFNNVEECGWDLGDCCEVDCRSEQDICGANGYDCRNPDSKDYGERQCVDYWLSDGLCDMLNNDAACDWDGGDCCPTECGRGQYPDECGAYGYCCDDPDSPDYGQDDCEAALDCDEDGICQ